MINMDIKYRVLDTNQVWINLTDLVDFLARSEEELLLLGKEEPAETVEIIEAALLRLGIHALTDVINNTLDQPL